MKVVIRQLHLLLLFLLRKRIIQGDEREGNAMIAKGSKMNKNESGNQAPSPSSSFTPPQTNNPRG